MIPTHKQLELAAKATGYQLEDIKGVLHRWVDSETGMGGCWLPWQPVTDKSDSRDLEVECKISLLWSNELVRADSHRGIDTFAYYKDYNNDKGLATMWAVFLCAVAIGEAMADGRSL